MGTAGVSLVLASLPCFFLPRIILLPKREVALIFAATFLVLGLFCRVSVELCGETTGIAGHFSSGGDALRGLITSIPFKSSSTPALLQALLTGDRSALDTSLVKSFRLAGASHILALSGLHMGVIYLLVSKVLSVFGNFPSVKRVRSFVIIAAAGYYTLMTGASASIVRAFLFILINELAKLSYRPRRPLRVYFCALLIQLVITPQAIEGLGFQLSYLAMAGIFLLFPHLDGLYPKGRGLLRKVWSAAVLSISCQVFTAPLVWLRLHSFPHCFMLTNLIAIPLTEVLVFLGITCCVLYPLGICPQALITVTDFVCRLLTESIGIIASM